jgi:16S rRNA (cytosine967-C5)-methyltransferase
MNNCEREWAFCALMAYETEGIKLRDFFLRCPLKGAKRALAVELAYSTMRMKRLLDFYAMSLCKRSLPKKKGEKWILRLFLYQVYCLSKIPLFAALSEMVELAKKYTHPSFAKFLNALGRKIDLEVKLPLPPDLGCRLSYPDFFVERIVASYGEKKAEKILDAQNKPIGLFARKRFRYPLEWQQLNSIIDSADIYIQNKTQGTLIECLYEKFPPPVSILDLCAAPGGKAILLSELFCKACLYCNDSSRTRLKLLEENLRKYSIEATLSCLPGEKADFKRTFDLILIDSPCSSSGVLFKCPEARWKISSDEMERRQKIQLALIHNAKEHLAPRGKIWYSTCSILPEENEHMVELAASRFGLKIDKTFLILPDGQEFEGGFIAQLGLISPPNQKN